MPTAALLIIDVQKAILDIPSMSRRAETQAALDGCVGRIAKLIAEARRRGIPVLYVQHGGDAGHRLERGSAGWQIRPEVAPLRDEPVIHKTACDSFFQTTLQAELEARNVDTLIVAGCMTQYCVDTSARRAVSLGYDVKLAGDGHMTADSGDLTFEQIIAHHNDLLDGFDAGSHTVRVVPIDRILP